MSSATSPPLHEAIMQQFKRVLGVYRDAYPIADLEFDRAYAGTHAARLKAWLGVLYLLVFRLPASRRYVFETLRNEELIQCLPADQICVLGGRQDRARCGNKGYTFFWTGGLVAAMVVAWRHGHTAPLRLQIAMAQKRFNTHSRYFFLYEDTLPVGIFFAFLGAERGRATVCIEHGFCTTNEIIVNGALCRYNLLYELAQQQYVETKDSTFFELGPPFDVLCGCEISREVILVGTGTKGLLPDFYFKSLEAYSRIARYLGQQGWRVVYRPHPCEDPADYSSLFALTDRGPKTACLSNARKVFIGYVSTLLFEAQTFGHGVICLLDPAMGPIAFTPHASVEADRIEELGAVVLRVQADMKTTPVCELRPVSERFLSILGEMQKLEQH